MRSLRIATAAAVTGLMCACPADAGSVKRLKLENSEAFGTYLVDAEGRPLYRFTKDQRAGDTPAMAGCYGKCQQDWPPAYTQQAPSAGVGLSQDTIATVMRNDATLQAAYDGWPLYFYSGDLADGHEPTGHNVVAYGGIWQLLAPEGNGSNE